MAGPIKPQFPNVPIHDLERTVQKLEDLVERTKTDRGEIDVGRLKAQAEASGDAAVIEMVGAIRDRFARVTSGGGGTVTSGCGGTSRAAPEKLSAEEVITVLDALREAEARIRAADANPRNQRLDKGEREGLGASDLAGRIARTAADAALEDYDAALRMWRSAVGELVRTRDARTYLDTRITRMAEFHAESTEGRDAIVWAFRAAAQKGSFDAWDAERALGKAEQHLLARVFPRTFGERKKGHLSDRELSDHFELRGESARAALIAHAEKRRAEVLASLAEKGLTYESYLEGKDLAGVEQAKDPDFGHGPARSSCG